MHSNRLTYIGTMIVHAGIPSGSTWNTLPLVIFFWSELSLFVRTSKISDGTYITFGVKLARRQLEQSKIGRLRKCLHRPNLQCLCFEATFHLHVAKQTPIQANMNWKREAGPSDHQECFGNLLALRTQRPMNLPRQCEFSLSVVPQYSKLAFSWSLAPFLTAGIKTWVSRS